MFQDSMDNKVYNYTVDSTIDEEDGDTKSTADMEDIQDRFNNIHGISPFLVLVVGGGVMLCVLICCILALVIRINMRRRDQEGKKILAKVGRSSVRSGCGGFDQPPYLRMRDPVRVNSARFTHRYHSRIVTTLLFSPLTCPGL